MSFPTYRAYKHCGDEWLRELPAHWVLSRLGYECWVRARLGWKGLKADEYVDDGFIFLATPNIKDREIDFVNVNYIDQSRFDKSPEIKLTPGDVLVAKDGSTLGTVNLIRYLPKPATVNSSIAVMTPGERLGSLFLFYLFRSSVIESTIQQLKGGMGVPHLFQDDLNRFRLPLPTLSEQTAICAFLDRETAKIDVLVEEQQRLIALLKEKRLAVISHAVTKGLDPNAPMKDSGVEWLGQVPAHWEVRQVKHVIEIATSGPRGWSETTGDVGAIFFQSQNIGSSMGIVLNQVVRVKPTDDAELRRATLLEGDVVVCITGARTASVAHIGNLPEPAFINQHVCMLRPAGHAIEGRFLAYVLFSSCGQEQLNARMYGLKQGLGLEDVKTVRVPLPTPQEQASIFEYLDTMSGGFDNLIADAESAIGVLQERRSALISAAVTGKIDVRGLTPAEAEAA